MPSTVGIVASGLATPLDLSPALWLDASDTSTITESGGAVSQWDDKSGNGRNFTQATAASQPASGITTINGLNVLDFNGDWVKLADDAGMRPSTLTTFIVFGNATGSGRRDLFSCGSSGTFATNNWIHGHTGTAQGFLGRTPTSNLTSGTFSGLTLGRWVHDGSTLTGALNGVATFNTASTVGSDNTLGVTIGASRTGALSPIGFYLGSIAEILFYPTVMSGSEISQVESYLSVKWGL